MSVENGILQQEVKSLEVSLKIYKLRAVCIGYAVVLMTFQSVQKLQFRVGFKRLLCTRNT